MVQINGEKNGNDQNSKKNKVQSSNQLSNQAILNSKHTDSITKVLLLSDQNMSKSKFVISSGLDGKCLVWNSSNGLPINLLDDNNNKDSRTNVSSINGNPKCVNSIFTSFGVLKSKNI